MDRLKEKKYLGDGVYFLYDGFQVLLTTENGIETTNEIYLEPEVLISLIEQLQNIGIIDLK